MPYMIFNFVEYFGLKLRQIEKIVNKKMKHPTGGGGGLGRGQPAGGAKPWDPIRKSSPRNGPPEKQD